MPANIDILFEDNHLLLINKPAGIPSQSDLTLDDSALDLAKSYIKKEYKKPGNVFVGLTHRLDRPVSGLLMLCKTSKALARMSQQFKNRTIEKSYLAIVDNIVEKQFYHLENYLIKDRKKNIARVVSKATKNAKHAEMYVEKMSAFGGATLLCIKPVTGRSHQIRVQLSSIGLPIIGDVKYGGNRHVNRRAICLHSHMLSFDHPVKKNRITIHCMPYQHHWNPFGQLLARIPNQ